MMSFAENTYMIPVKQVVERYYMVVITKETLSNNVPDVALTTNEENFFLFFNIKQWESIFMV